MSKRSLASITVLVCLLLPLTACKKKPASDGDKKDPPAMSAMGDTLAAPMHAVRRARPAMGRPVTARPAPAKRPTPVKLFRHVSKKGGYEILLLGPPKIKTQTVPTVAGTLSMTFAMSEQKGNGCGPALGCMAAAAFNDVPDKVIKASTPDKLLDGARDGALKNTASKLLTEKKIKLGPYPGRELTMKRSFGATEAHMMVNHVRIFLVKNRMYQVQFITTKPYLSNPAIRQVLDSFKLTK